MVHILSFDCANKSIAFSYFYIDIVAIKAVRYAKSVFASTPEVTQHNTVIDKHNYTLTVRRDYDTRDALAYAIKHLPDKKTAAECIVNLLTGKAIDMLRGGSFDLLPGRKVKDTSLIDRTRALRSWLCDNFKDIAPDTIVLIENQARDFGKSLGNSKSATVQDQLCFHFADHRVEIVSPLKKNTISMCPALDIKNIRGEYSNAYLANKAHARRNMLAFYETVGKPDYLSEINKKQYSDHGDALLQAIAWVSNAKDI